MVLDLKLSLNRIPFIRSNQWIWIAFDCSLEISFWPKLTCSLTNPWMHKNTSLQVTRLNTVERCYERGLDYNITKITYILDFIARYISSQALNKKVISNILRFLVILNSSINFVIYCVFGSQFRQELSTLVWNKLRRISLQKVSANLVSPFEKINWLNLI